MYGWWESTVWGAGLRRRLGLIGVASLAASLALASSASAYIYWSAVGRIARANLDGSGVNPRFINGGYRMHGIAVDDAHVYWATHEYGTIGRANLDGANDNPSFMAGIKDPGAVASDGVHIYWSQDGFAGIGRANVDGSDANPSFIGDPGVRARYGIAVDGAHVYWAAGSGAIGRANLDGSGANPTFIPAITGADPYGLAVDGGHVYWANYAGNTIGRANLDGSGFDLNFITGANGPTGVAVDGSYVYWTNEKSGTIGRANLDGSGANESLVAGAGAPFGLAVDVLGPGGPKPRPVKVSPKVVGLPGRPPRIGGALDDVAPTDLSGFGAVIKESLAVTVDGGVGPIALPAGRHTSRRIVKTYTLAPGQRLHFRVPSLGPGVRTERVTMAVSILTRLNYEVRSSRSYTAKRR